MYAVIKSGGKQYRVAAGGQLRVEALPAEVGAPYVAGAAVKATVVSHGRGDKVKIFKLRRRKHYQKSQGHRQSYTEVRIDDIVSGA